MPGNSKLTLARSRAEPLPTFFCDGCNAQATSNKKPHRTVSSMGLVLVEAVSSWHCRSALNYSLHFRPGALTPI